MVFVFCFLILFSSTPVCLLGPDPAPVFFLCDELWPTVVNDRPSTVLCSSTCNVGHGGAVMSARKMNSQSQNQPWEFFLGSLEDAGLTLIGGSPAALERPSAAAC